MPVTRPPKSPRRGSRRPDAATVEAALGPVESATLAALRSLRTELGREPELSELAERVGISEKAAGVALGRLGALGLGAPLRLTRKQRQCLAAIRRLELRLGGSPSTIEVSDEMGLCASGSRYHIHQLADMGLVTRPEVRLVLRLTPAGLAALPGTEPEPGDDGEGRDGGEVRS